jgi:hypothetical protein
MDLSKYHNITNHYQDVHLISLRTWADAATIQPQDNGGPYLIAQEGFDPEDVTLTPDEFLLGRGGVWVSTRHFFRMGKEARRAEYIFGTAAEVAALMSSLPAKPAILRPGSPEPSADVPDDGLQAAYRQGLSETPPQ